MFAEEAVLNGLTIDRSGHRVEPSKTIHKILLGRTIGMWRGDFFRIEGGFYEIKITGIVEVEDLL